MPSIVPADYSVGPRNTLNVISKLVEEKHSNPKDTKQSALSEVPSLVLTASGTADDRNTEYVKLVGLPYQATEQDIVAFLGGAVFFHEADLKSDVTLLKGKCGAPNGRAVVRLCNEDEAKRVSKGYHMKTLQWRYIEVYHVGAKEVGWYKLPLMKEQPITTKSPKSRSSNNDAAQKRMTTLPWNTASCYVHNPYTLQGWDAVEVNKGK